eukprot:CAMPEP_0117026214 /NCGR_PEP_ID=MMETSP0472-20121206/19298_1 /TAXON_ID=693140 ORGANISM="Tiarina fusus, Strain LIS" /NCGR_SAMPLE_ID=MMETSP0472 /ASSEMBLY_ACC=CAM_ASM_000603 /LENGTH=173 /DNA_ID=CAMNT_0004733167 /DNA_START=109 /DNA_END=630 /DNA_ORIENTATION=-
MSAAKIRGSATEPEVEFRKLMMGGGGMPGGVCPDASDKPNLQCSSNSDCATNMVCFGREGCCCVSANTPYCGVPSECNQFLQCLPSPGAGTGTGIGTQGGTTTGTGTGTGTGSNGITAGADCSFCTVPTSGLPGKGMFRTRNGICTEECVDGLAIAMKQAEGWRCGVCPPGQF